MPVSKQTKLKVLAWLPLMKELELMGFDPVREMFLAESLSLEQTENHYIALTRCKAKHPKWYEVMAEYVRL